VKKLPGAIFDRGSGPEGRGAGMAPRTKLPGAIFLAFAGILAACSGGLRSHAPPQQSYVLRAVDPPARAASVSVPRASLRVLFPTAAPGLDSEHIMLLQADRRLSYYAATRWAAALPAMVEQLTVQTFRRTGAWRAVEDSAGVWPADYFLQLDIRRFESDYTGGPGPPTVHVAFDCTLGRRSGDDELVASFVAEHAVTAEQNRMGAVVQAFERAADAALAEAAERAQAAIDEKSGAAAAADKTAGTATGPAGN
jgi:cholesterol transport system auxiliary component